MEGTAVAEAPGTAAPEAPAPPPVEAPDSAGLLAPDSAGEPTPETDPIEALLESADEATADKLLQHPKIKERVDKRVEASSSESVRRQQEQWQRAEDARQRQIAYQQTEDLASDKAKQDVIASAQALLDHYEQTGVRPPAEALAKVAAAAEKQTRAQEFIALDQAFYAGLPQGTEAPVEFVDRIDKARASGSKAHLAAAYYNVISHVERQRGIQQGIAMERQRVAAQQAGDANADKAKAARQAAVATPQPTSISGAGSKASTPKDILQTARPGSPEYRKAYRETYGFDA